VLVMTPFSTEAPVATMGDRNKCAVYSGTLALGVAVGMIGFLLVGPQPQAVDNGLGKAFVPSHPLLRGQSHVARASWPQMVDAAKIKQLRQMTGAGLGDCKKALEEHNDDLDKAADDLRQKGIAKAEKRTGRSASEGTIATYIHTGAKMGVMVEVNCETDFVAKNDEFKKFADEIALAIAAYSTVQVVSEDDISPEMIEKEKEVERGAEDLQGKPADVIEKIVQGRVNKILKDRVLLNQPWLFDESLTTGEYIKSQIGKMGENMKVARFTRFSVGGD